ncbi:hypothetical protein FSP39_007224 [Pinctada imbricata]|uniref:Uncharacterized protein n=1 Tax=Pinctada imbricata TaxID=66713 RepID=A0AA88XKQ3_PINIB|nr:hypothetical protein FSP39_007224 [Pinctada imbricata]
MTGTVLTSLEITNTLTEITKNSRKIEIENSELKKDLSKIKNQMKELNDQQLDLQTRSMRDNLIFYGIEEKDGENCESVLKEFIADVLKVEQRVEFHRVHRMGRKIHGKIRPIVAKFVQFKEREVVRKSVYTSLAGNDENKKYGINEQFPRIINERRKKLYPYYKSAKRQNKRAQLVVDKLFIDGELFRLDESESDDDDMEIHPVTNPESDEAVTMTMSSQLSANAPTFYPGNRGRGRGRGGHRGRGRYSRK